MKTGKGLEPSLWLPSAAADARSGNPEFAECKANPETFPYTCRVYRSGYETCFTSTVTLSGRIVTCV